MIVSFLATRPMVGTMIVSFTRYIENLYEARLRAMGHTAYNITSLQWYHHWNVMCCSDCCLAFRFQPFAFVANQSGSMLDCGSRLKTLPWAWSLPVKHERLDTGDLHAVGWGKDHNQCDQMAILLYQYLAI